MNLPSKIILCGGYVSSVGGDTSGRLVIAKDLKGPPDPGRFEVADERANQRVVNVDERRRLRGDGWPGSKRTGVERQYLGGQFVAGSGRPHKLAARSWLSRSPAKI